VYEILAKENLGPVTKLYEVQAPVVAQKARAGQFVIVRLTKRGSASPDHRRL
jgi:ferredoxin/flavodoxin---NADP+ reductase